ncbi:MAG: type II toxin-antitoxin system Phd/YefM family antitoxin [Nitrospirae bacterium]|nr:type II toxin-antitoxin system Phd/YefM family antitoxin [Nitrospirota bacterium]MBI3393992.1 type II toxin-antitoxin system Phd/YefM family antitoxin [Nitrospirota bacterium]
MKATILDLRYRMKDVLKALERNETVDILYHGRPKGVITAQPGARRGKVADHPFFGMRKRGRSVEREMDGLRGGRYRDL